MKETLELLGFIILFATLVLIICVLILISLHEKHMKTHKYEMGMPADNTYLLKSLHPTIFVSDKDRIEDFRMYIDESYKARLNPTDVHFADPPVTDLARKRILL